MSPKQKIALAHELSERGQYSGAASLFEANLSPHTTDSSSLARLAKCYENLGDFRRFFSVVPLVIHAAEKSGNRKVRDFWMERLVTATF